jgi:DNA polymerase III subunit epsilon
MFQNASDLAAMAEALSRSTDYRVLRRLVPRPTSMPPSGRETKIGILLDTETTGLDHRRDELIELGMVKFDYTPDGRIIGVRDTFSAFNEPSEPIPAEITALTGITDEMVAGHKIEEAAVNAFVEGAVITIAHNCGFDRKFAERSLGPPITAGQEAPAAGTTACASNSSAISAAEGCTRTCGLNKFEQLKRCYYR